jgi:prefoldin subunit 5
MNLTELKAQAYDILAQIEYLQKQLQEVNQKIAEELQKEKNENG